MKTYLKALGLALVAALAMSAVAASAAQAENATFTAEGYPAVAKGEQESGTDENPIDNYFEITSGANHEGGDRTECDVAVYEATLIDASHELTVTPHYDKCSGSTIELNGCHFVFKTHGTEKVISETKSEVPGTADVVCPDGQSITITGPFGTCEVHVHAQTGLEGITFTNTTPTAEEEEEGKKKYVTVDVNVTTEIEYEETDVGTFCAYTEEHTTADGNFVSSVKVDGFEDGTPTSHATTEDVETYGKGAATDIDVK